MQLQTVDGDLLDQDVDVIVNAWNRNIIPWWLLLPQGVSGAIKKRGGHAPFRELGKLGPIPLGGAVITGAGKLPFKSIIHVAGIACGGDPQNGQFAIQHAMQSHLLPNATLNRWHFH